MADLLVEIKEAVDAAKEDGAEVSMSIFIDGLSGLFDQID